MEQSIKKIAIIGSGTWATALIKLLNDNNESVNWWVRSQASADYMRKRHHNPRYLSSVTLNMELINISGDLKQIVEESEYLVFAIPSAYIPDIIEILPQHSFKGKTVISAIKGLIPKKNLLFNQYLKEKFSFEEDDYYTIMGPCHAEEIASEKLSVLTFSGKNPVIRTSLAKRFQTAYLSVRDNNDSTGVQYAAILKNIYALGAGIAHGLEYGDNFQSVFITNAASEMFQFIKAATGMTDSSKILTSPYLGDLLVTCYSLYSRNRTFGNMIGKGYSSRAAILELNMVAEGYNASKAIFRLNTDLGVSMPIVETVYHILWENRNAAEAFRKLEKYFL